MTHMDKSRPAFAPGYEYPSYGTGNWHNTWYPASMVDANGKEVPWVDYQGNTVRSIDERCRPAPGQRFLAERATHPLFAKHVLIKDLAERIKKGEYTLPLYADLASMPWYERKAIWGLMVGNEGRTKIPVKANYEAAGFDSAKDMLQSYYTLSGEGYPSQDRTLWQASFRQEAAGNAGDVLVDWDLKSSLDGLYVAGDALFAGNYYHHACATGRYAGRKAADYASKQVPPAIDRRQVEREKARVYGPTKRRKGKDWIDWKELRAAGARAMQNYCGGLRNEGLMTTGLKWVTDLLDDSFPEAYASNPHILLRVLETYNILTCDQLIFHACLARKASSQALGHFRQDYPEVDPPEWHKWITLRASDGVVRTGELPIAFWGPLSENYEAHNPRYEGFLNGK